MNKFAFLIGIDSYKDKTIRRLNCAEADALQMAEMLREVCGFKHVQQLRGENATVFNMSESCDKLRHEIKPDDLLLIYFSGHGYEHPDQGHLLLFYDTIRKTLERSPSGVLPVRSLEQQFRELPCRRFLFILDACRGDIDSTRSIEDSVMKTTMYRDISPLVETGDERECHVICSCRAGELAVEIEPISSGAFTKAFTGVVKNRVAIQQSVVINDEFLGEVDHSLKQLLEEYGFNRKQRSWKQGGADALELVSGYARTSVNIPLFIPEVEYKNFVETILESGGTLEQARKRLVEKREALDLPVETCLQIEQSEREKFITTIHLPGGIPMQFRFIPSGTFWMGSSDEEIAYLLARYKDQGIKPEWVKDEAPRHPVTISPFYLSPFEVTNAQFKTFVKDTGHVTTAENEGTGRTYDGKEWKYVEGATWRDLKLPADWEKQRKGAWKDHPVSMVSWHDAKAFCEWISRITGQEYRLPTEAEWEYACRAGTQTRRWWGDDNQDNQACAYANVADKAHGWNPCFDGDDGHKISSPVGSFKPNAFGLYDMLGNVWEWCEDGYGSEFYKKSPKEDPVNIQSNQYRVIRGGSWGSDPRGVRCAYRIMPPENRTTQRERIFVYNSS